MYELNRVLIASTSKAVIGYVKTRIEDIGAGNEVITAQDDFELKNSLMTYEPEYLLIEGCFYHEATPQEVLKIIKRYDSLRVIIFGLQEYSDNYLITLFRSGVDGYLNIRKGRVSFYKELKEALAGYRVIPQQFEGMVFDMPNKQPKMTSKDMKVAHLIIDDELENKQIAAVLNVKEQTIKNRRTAMYEKLQVKNAIGLLKQLVRMGLMDSNEIFNR